MTSITIVREPVASAALAQAPPASPSLSSRTHVADETPPGTSPLLLEGWLEYNRLVHGLQPHRFHVGSHEQGARLDAVLYLDDKGRVRHPWRNPYLPVSFRPTATSYAHRIERQWHESAAQLVGEMRHRGVVNTLNLPPSLEDVRPWLWAGYRVGLRYTFIVDFPFDLSHAASTVRSRVRGCERKGYRVERTTDFDAVYSCLRATEERQGYRLGVTRAGLDLARELLGDDHLIAFAAFAPNGEVASAAVNLHVPGSMAIGWLGGSRTEHLRSGSADLVEVGSWPEMENLGATAMDLCGANLPTIAAHKVSLGARLVPYYTVEPYSGRRLAAWTRNWWRFLKKRNEVIEHAAR